jgi:oligopeptide/dipeptide ABC transporter ATP-binding protein
VPINDPRERGKRNRIHLMGEVADPSNPPSGCYFHPRCQYAEDRCVTDEPKARQIIKETDHRAACHFSEKLDLRGVIIDDPA